MNASATSGTLTHAPSPTDDPGPITLPTDTDPYAPVADEFDLPNWSNDHFMFMSLAKDASSSDLSYDSSSGSTDPWDPDTGPDGPPGTGGPNSPLGPSTPQSIEIIEKAPLPAVPAGGGGTVSGGGGPYGPQPERPPVPVAAPDKPQKPRPAPPIVSGLGKEVDKLLNMSPTMRELWKRAQDKGYHIEFRNGKNETDYENSTIFINPNSLVDGHKLTPAELASLASHEVDHAAKGGFRPIEDTNREGYTRKNTDREIAGEASAALSNARVRDEIKSAGGGDIGVRGGLDDEIDKIYERRKSGDIATDEEAIELLKGVEGRQLRYLSDGKTKATTEEAFLEKWRMEYDRTHPQ